MSTRAQKNIKTVRRDFPILKTRVHDKSLAYLDNAATTQKPKEVVEAISGFYNTYNSNIHRGIHALSQRATEAYEAARQEVQKFIGASSVNEIVFTRGATEAINLVAATFGETKVKKGDNIIISALEHHANIVPWQQLCEKKGADLRVAPLDQQGRVKVDELKKLISKKTKMIALIWTSNSLGVINPVAQLIRLAKRYSIPILLDASQTIQHQSVNVRTLGCDFLVFSGHKLYGPTGIGVLYGREDFLNAMPPYQTGGDMIQKVTFEQSTFKPAPARFEAGTPHIAGAIGLAAAIRYLKKIGWSAIQKREKALLRYATQKLRDISGVRIIGDLPEKAPIISFTVEGIHPHDLGTVLDREGVAIRTGHHCNQPLMDYFGIPATARASFSFYNTESEIDRLVRGIKKAQKIFHV